MNTDVNSIVKAVEVTAYRIPTDTREADGTLAWDATEIVVVKIRAGGKTGLGYSYTAGLPAADIIRNYLGPCVTGRDLCDLPMLWADMNRTLRNIGRAGLGMMAIAAVDQALWDLKAKLLCVSLTTLWGSYRDAINVYGSGGFTTYSAQRLEHQLFGWMDLGLTAVKIKIGEGLEADAKHMHITRAAIGSDIDLMVDANGAYTPRTARALMDELVRVNVCWFEEPVSSDDLEGLSWLRNHAPGQVAIAAGEYGWDSIYFRRMLVAGAVDVLQADATRCGYTGFLQAALLCDAFQIPLSAHCAPAIHAAVCAAVPRLIHLEYFHDHVRVESLLFSDGPTLHEGKLWPNRELHGHGLNLRIREAEQYRL